MSKIGKLPIEIKNGVNISIDGKKVDVTGPKGNLSWVIPEGIEAKISEDKLIVSENKNKSFEKEKKNTKNRNALFGLTRAIIMNMVTGVTSGFEKKLELSGVGYRAQLAGSDLILSLGFSHPVKIEAVPGVEFKIAENVISIIGIDKNLVGETSAKIRAIRPPEPYKGKGISYKGERIRRKAGKAAKAVGGK